MCIETDRDLATVLKRSMVHLLSDEVMVQG